MREVQAACHGRDYQLSVEDSYTLQVGLRLSRGTSPLVLQKNLPGRIYQVRSSPKGLRRGNNLTDCAESTRSV